MHQLRALFPKFQRLARSRGIHVDYFGRPPSTEAALYKPLFQPWRSPAWQAKLRATDPHSLVSLDRKYILYRMLEESLRRADGDIAECGVYMGGTAYMFGTILESSPRPLHLFDTFAGMPATNPDKDRHQAGDFRDTSLVGVQEYLSRFPFIAFHPGLVPASLASVSEQTFAFVHIDLDIYDPVASATAFFYSRLARGGVMLYDDYGFPSCPGARDAVDEFFADKPESLIVLQTGQCMIWKL